MNHNMSFSTHPLFKSLRRRPICTSSIVALHRSLTLQSKRRSRSRRNITRRSQTTDGNWHFLSSNDTLSPEACMTQGGCVTCTQTSPDCWRLSSKDLASRPRRLFVRAPFLNVPIWIILTSLWVQCRFRKAGLSSFFWQILFAEHPMYLHTKSSKSDKNLCIAILSGPHGRQHENTLQRLHLLKWGPLGHHNHCVFHSLFLQNLYRTFCVLLCIICLFLFMIWCGRPISFWKVEISWHHYIQLPSCILLFPSLLHLLYHILDCVSIFLFSSFVNDCNFYQTISQQTAANVVLLCHATLCFPFVTLFGHRCKTAIVFFTFDSLSRLEEGHEHENWHAAHGLLKRATWTPNDHHHQNFYRCPSTTHNAIHQINLPSPKRRLVHQSMVGFGF